MRILVLGGTKFFGRHFVEAALARNHEVTLFNRGQTGPDLFPGVEKRTGDRDGNLTALQGGYWDAVVDPSGFIPRVVRQSVDVLKQAAGHYTFISSISVYADFTQADLHETAPVAKLADETSEELPQHYGELKALCEQEVQYGFGDKALVIRPGLIVGPHDPTDRFTYWVRRFAQGGDILVPGRRNYPIQVIDARDLAKWVLSMVEGQGSGVFNAAGPKQPLTMEGFVEELLPLGPPSTGVTWVSEKFLTAQGVEEWQDLPLWISDKTGWPGFQTANVERALAHGLVYRPLRQTILDTLHWDETRVQATVLKAGLTREREAELLRHWRDFEAR